MVRKICNTAIATASSGSAAMPPVLALCCVTLTVVRVDGTARRDRREGDVEL